MPLSEQRNTITMAPLTGESDICPKDNSFNPVQVHCCGLSVQVSSRNLHQVCTSFLPPSAQVTPAAGSEHLSELLQVQGGGLMEAAGKKPPVILTEPG